MKYIFVTAFVFLSSASIASWFHSSGNYKSNKYSIDTQIKPQNIDDLNIAWQFSSGQTKSIVQASPVYTGTKIVAITTNRVYAIEPVSGELIWEKYLDKGSPYKIDSNIKGITYKNLIRKSIYVPTTKGVLELNEADGSIINHYFSGSSALAPVLYNNKIIIATRRDGVKAFDVSSHELIWHLETKKNDYQSTIWSGFSFNEDIGLAFVVTGSSGGITGWYRNDPNFENTLIAIDVETGQIKWSFQHIDHDLWDLDIVGNPMSFSLILNSKKIFAVVALTKTGDVIYLDALTGKPIFEDSFRLIAVPQSDIPNEMTASHQKKFFKPTPFTSTVIDIDDDFSHLEGDNLRYVKNKIRRARSNFYLPPSLDYDVILYGLHGGAEWPGGSINFSEGNPALIVPYNKDPWILRAYYQDRLYRAVEVISNKYEAFISSFGTNLSPNEIYISNCSSCHEASGAPDRSSLASLSSKKIYEIISSGSMAMHAANLSEDQRSELSKYLSNDEVKNADQIFQSLPFTPSNKIYQQNCMGCHGPARRGMHESETYGDKYVPPLTGVTLTQKKLFVESFEQIKSLHQNSEITYNVSAQDHKEIFDEFHKYDARLKKMGLMKSRGFWQVLLDANNNPATKPPWGGISKIDLITGNEIWNIPFGSKNDKNVKGTINGLRNFGGLISTKSGLIFATGTNNSKAYAFNMSGKLIWSDNLPYDGSAPPITFTHNNCQYVVFTSTGGKWHDSGFIGDKLISYKLDSCINKQN